MKTLHIQALLYFSFAWCLHGADALDPAIRQIIHDACQEYVNSDANTKNSLGLKDILLIDADFALAFKQLDALLVISPLEHIARKLNTFAQSQQTPEDELKAFDEIERLITSNKQCIKKEQCCKKHAIKQQILTSKLSYNHQKTLIYALENIKNHQKNIKNPPKKLKKYPF